MPGRYVTGRGLRTAVERATESHDVPWTVTIRHEASAPRIYDESTNFDSVADEGWFGCYIIYATQRSRTNNLGPSRIQYIGKGWVDSRGKAHLRNKPTLRRLSQTVDLKFVTISWAGLNVVDSHAAWVCEQILLLEHEFQFGDIPHFNRQRASSRVESWRRVIRWSSRGPVALLRRYGG